MRCFALLCAGFALSSPRQDAVPPGQRWEGTWESAAGHPDPLRDVQLAAEFVSPSGKKRLRAGFWDGGRTWRVRFSPDEAGRWTFATRSNDSGLTGKSGAFEAGAVAGPEALSRHGAVRLSEDRRHLAHADGRPFFWLACTAWNGALHSEEKSWADYLADRKSKGFTAIQFVTIAPWRACRKDRDGLVAFEGQERIALDPRFFQRMDRRIEAVSAAGLVAAPVLLWALGKSPGVDLPESEAILLARYQLARWGAHPVVWILGGDGDYRGPKAEKWKRIGRAVFADDRSRPVAMHCGGQHWPLADLRGEPWFDILGYQSGHGDGDASLKWLVAGPPATGWREEPAVPLINMEINYEAHVAYQSRKSITDFQVRRAAWWSCLATPTAGVTYGAHGVWWWSPTDTAEVPLDHPRAGVAQSWREAAALPGSGQMKHLAALFADLEWWRLRPAPEIILLQPGEKAPAQFVAAAKTEKGDLAVIYSPGDAPFRVKGDAFPGPMRPLFLDPRTGGRRQAVDFVWGSEVQFTPPGEGDWVLVLRKDS